MHSRINHGIKEVLVRIEVSGQIWTEVISYGQKTTADIRKSSGDTQQRITRLELQEGSRAIRHSSKHGI